MQYRRKVVDVCQWFFQPRPLTHAEFKQKIPINTRDKVSTFDKVFHHEALIHVMSQNGFVVFESFQIAEVFAAEATRFVDDKPCRQLFYFEPVGDLRPWIISNGETVVVFFNGPLDFSKRVVASIAVDCQHGNLGMAFVLVVDFLKRW